MYTDERPTHSGLSRRTIMKTAAWSAPVIAVAAATPAAAASTVQGVDLYATGLQQGSSFSFYSTDLTTKYTATEPSGFTLLNKGTESAPAGSVTVQARYDNRVYTPDRVYVHFGDTDTEASFTVTDVAGNASTISFVIPIEMPVETDVFGPNAIRVRTILSPDVTYPNDMYDNYVEPMWTIVYADDADPTNNIFGPWAATSEPATPWGLTLEAETATETSDSCSVEVVTSATITSVGPNPTPSSLNGTMYIDSGLISNVTLTTATLDGADVLGDITFTKETSQRYSYAYNQQLATNEVLVLAFDYDAIADGVTDGSTFNQINVYGAEDPNNSGSRRTVSWFDAESAVCTP